MDMIYIITHPVSCFTNDPWLEDRSVCIDDRRLIESRLWAHNEKDLYKKEKRKHEGPRPWTKVPWVEAVFDGHLQKNADKSLVLLYYTPLVAEIMDKRLAQGRDDRGNRLLTLSLFHSDDDTARQFVDWRTPEQRLEEKHFFLKLFQERHPYIIIREIPFDFTLSAAWLLERFEEYVLGDEGE